jgi:hypothetical protein
MPVDHKDLLKRLMETMKDDGSYAQGFRTAVHLLIPAWDVLDHAIHIGYFQNAGSTDKWARDVMAELETQIKKKIK